MEKLENVRKVHEALNQIKVRCKKCGHTMAITNKHDKVICGWCGNYIFKTEKAEFLYRIKEAENRCKNG